MSEQPQKRQKMDFDEGGVEGEWRCLIRPLGFMNGVHTRVTVSLKALKVLDFKGKV